MDPISKEELNFWKENLSDSSVTKVVDNFEYVMTVNYRLERDYISWNLKIIHKGLDPLFNLSFEAPLYISFEYIDGTWTDIVEEYGTDPRFPRFDNCLDSYVDNFLDKLYKEKSLDVPEPFK